jgi:fermentation-respiration switch protein FrsA (DUF1100 family)
MYPTMPLFGRAGLVAIAGEMWATGNPGKGWGNQLAKDAIRASWNHLKNNYGAKTDKLLFVCGSGGGANALNFARSYPTEVAAIGICIGALNVDDFHDRDVLGLGSEIEECWGGTLATWNTNEPTANPWKNFGELEGIPIYVFLSDDDPTTPPQYQQDLIDQVVSASGESVGNRGHGFGLTSVEGAIEFVSRYR